MAFGDGKDKSRRGGFNVIVPIAVMALRNPVSHRFVDEIDENYTRDVIHTVNLLLRVMESDA